MMARLETTDETFREIEIRRGDSSRGKKDLVNEVWSNPHQNRTQCFDRLIVVLACDADLCHYCEITSCLLQNMAKNMYLR